MLKRTENMVKRPPKSDMPDRILDLLGEDGAWRSGEELAGLLGVSRAAIGKHAAALRRAGHVIMASTRKGYALLVRHEPVDEAAVRRRLRTRLVGRTGWRNLAEAASSNNEAIAWALAGAPAGAVVTAERQTGGKGRIGHAWFSSPHGLHFSLILRPGTADESAILGRMLSAIGRAVEIEAGVKTSIKRPNDLLADGRKIAGVLTESGLRGDAPDWLVVGVGCNVNVQPEEFPAAIKAKAASLYEITGRAVSRNALLAAILNQFEESASA